MDHLERTRLILGEDAMARLRGSRVAVFGIGGVGGHCAEALARSGIGAIDLIDNDTVSLTNLNRQLVALRSTIGRYKTEVLRERIADIDPELVVTEHRCFFLPENQDQFDFSAYDYVVDAVDTVTAKIALILASQAANTPVISSMGAGNKLHPEMFELADIYQTSVCPLAKVMRHELKKRGVRHLKCVYSREVPRQPGTLQEENVQKRAVPGSTAFTPSVAGLIIAGEVIRDLAGVR